MLCTGVCCAGPGEPAYQHGHDAADDPQPAQQAVHLPHPTGHEVCIALSMLC